MPPKYFASISYPLTLAIALVTLNLICQSLEVQAAELIGTGTGTPGPTPLLHNKRSTAPLPTTMAVAEPAPIRTASPVVQDPPKAAIESSPQIPQQVPLPTQIAPLPDVPSTVLSPPEALLQPPDQLPDLPPDQPPDQASSQPPAGLPQAPPPALSTAADPHSPAKPAPTESEIPPNTAPQPQQPPQTTFVERFEVKASTVFDTDQLAAVARQAAVSDKDLEDLLNAFCDTAPDEPFQDIRTADATPIDPCCSNSIDPSNLLVQRNLTADQLQRASAAIIQLYDHCGYSHAQASLSTPPSTEQDHVVQIQVTEGNLEASDNSANRAPKPNSVARSVASTPPATTSGSPTKPNSLVSQVPSEIPSGVLRDVLPRIIPHDSLPSETPPLPQEPSPALPPAEQLLRPSQPPATEAIEDIENVFNAQLLEDLLNAFCDAEPDASLQSITASLTDSTDPNCSTFDLSTTDPSTVESVEENNVFNAQLLEELLNTFCDEEPDEPFQGSIPSSTDLVDSDCLTTNSFNIQFSDISSAESFSLLNSVARSTSLTSPFPETVSTSTITSPVLVAQASPNLAQDTFRDVPQDFPRNVLPQIIPRDPIPPSPEPLPEVPPPPLPPPEQLLQPSEPPSSEPEVPSSEAARTVFVEQFRVEGSTVFDTDELATLAWQATALESDAAIPDLIRSYCPDSRFEASADPSETSQDIQDSEDTEDTEDTEDEDTEDAIGDRAAPSQESTNLNETNIPNGQELSFEQLLRARSAITRLYIKCGYITSGAILPPQTPEEQDNTVIIQVVEGSLEAIEVTGLRRLNSSYVRRRLAVAGSEPLNQERLLQGLQLLQLNPLIRRISADLQAGTRPATSILRVEATEADTFNVTLDLNNNRSPSVGSFQQGITFTQANLLGFGDGLSVTYNHTEGSNEVEGNYIIPVNPRNGTVILRAGYTHSHVIEPPFDVLDIEAESPYYEVTFRQPIFQIPTEEFALGLTFSRQASQTELGIDDIGPFPLSLGADEEGRTRVSAIRFTQDWLKRTPRQVIAARSQFSLGLDLFDATVNDAPLPDSRFFAWRGQAQWVRQLNERGILLLARADMQFTGDSLLPLEQFGLGGQDTVRGYRQDAVLTDNGVLGSVEVRFPVLRVRDWAASLYLVPFLDVGTGWNVNPSTNPEDGTLVGTGIGLLWEMDDNLIARVDWGIPLVSIDSRERTWQESGVYFSIRYTPF